ncbi:double-strand break repair protein AddB [Minwuia sp.]|uniref:double-strand break repair protein AddB n=1 Tax=Minwuia sp. TaxID=2493630 RepID=UPI003A948969
MGQVASIAAGQPFVDVLAGAMLAAHGPGGDGLLADALVLVPTRRAVRSLRQAFLRASNGTAMLLPAIHPLGDVEDDEPAMLSPLVHDEADLPPAIGQTERRLLLAQLVLKSGATPDMATALGLAQSLADFLDEVATERRDFAKLADLAPERFQAHWQETIDFLQIVTRFWPEMLSERDRMDPAHRRDLLTGRLAAEWRAHPPETPVYIAGSTGSVPGTADLMAATLAAPAGHIILPGLDLSLDEADRAAAHQEPAHPQHGMLVLLERLGIAPPDVVPMSDDRHVERIALINEALRPAATTERWRDLAQFSAEALDGLSLLEAPGPREEALAIALRLREVLETPGRTAALVTPDRALARRVAAEMARFGVRLDDSAGVPLRLTRAGSFLQLAAVGLSTGFAPADLLALLKHPLAAAGQRPDTLRRETRRLERRHLRGLRTYDDLAGLADRVDADGAFDFDTGWLREIARHAAAFQKVDGDLAALLAAHVECCEWLASTGDQTGAQRLWRGEDGEAAAQAVADLLESAEAAPSATIGDWPASFDRLIGGGTVRPRHGLHPRLSILGPLEARLQNFDLVILGGLNEGVWPAATGHDPWMSRPMRADFGLSAPERRTGLQAHDFVQLAAAGRVILTRSAKADGAPTVPSRWLLRLQSVASGAGITLARDTESTDWAAMLDRADDPKPVGAPAPRPPVQARPSELPVTSVETLIRDPYAIYARRILKLRALDPIDQEPGPMQKGNILHEAFEAFAKVHTGDWSPALLPTLRDIGMKVFAEKGLPPSWHALWMRRFEIAARWLLKVEGEREDRIEKRLAEIRGEISGLPGVPDFRLTATTDRLDVLARGGVTIVDYKTGTPPSKKQIEAGFAVQLPLTGLILRQGGFDGVPPLPDALVHIRVHGAREGGEWKPVQTDDLEALITETADGVGQLLGEYADESTPYRSRPYVQFARDYGGDYDHLARVAEWSVSADEEDGS